VVVGG